MKSPRNSTSNVTHLDLLHDKTSFVYSRSIWKVIMNGEKVGIWKEVVMA